MGRVTLLILICCLPVAISAQAPAPVGGVRGVVLDQSGGVLQEGHVEITASDTGLSKSTLTDQRGAYAFDELPLGRYRITAAFSGFETSARDVVVAAGQAMVVDFSLNITKTESAVQVTAVAPTVGPDTLAIESVSTSDTASLLDWVPGVSLYRSGGISSLPVIRGMGDDRVKVRVNGMAVESACANHMNPALSYIAPASIGQINVLVGVTPVSAGGDSIGGSISVDTAVPEFARPGAGLLTRGSVSTFYRSNAGGAGGNAAFSVATEIFRVAYTGAYTDADNYVSGGGDPVKSTFFRSTNHAAQVAVGRDDQLVTVDLGLQDVRGQGFPNARMDMTSNRGTFASAGYDDRFDWGRLTARGYYQDTRHQMNILRDKIPGMNMPMETKGLNTGYSLKADLPLSPRHVLRVGHEFSRFLLDDWWPPASATVGSMGPDTLWNVRDGKRDRFGTYVEWEAKPGAQWTSQLGLRSDVVRMDTGNVVGYNDSWTTTGSAAYAADAAEFNARDHRRLDSNVDLTALVKYAPASTSSYEIGFARKTRAPSLYERYLWVKRSNMSVQMNGWFGDANGYTGNLDLRPEVAGTLNASASWRGAGDRDWDVKVSPFYTHVADYIDVERCPVIPGSNGCTAAKLVATTGFVNLQFINQSARLYGVDVSGRVLLGGTPALGAFTLAGIASYVRGTNLDTGDNLYQIMPIKTMLSLEHRRGTWVSALDVQAIGAKKNVQAVRVELDTPGYALVNLRTSYQWRFVRLDAGIDNLFDKAYALPLGGRYWIGDKTGATVVPGVGRAPYVGVTFAF